MTHISRKEVHSIDYKEAQKQLVESIAGLNTKGATYFVCEIFTEAERIMIIKRFAAIFMFQQNYSYYRVSQTIGISTSTARLIFENYCNGQYNKFLASIPKKQKNAFLEIVEDFIMSRASKNARSRLLKRTFQ